MLSIFDGLRDITFFSVVFRMLFAYLCGGVIGIERSYKNRPAGFRTHILVCIGATVASMTGLYLYLNVNLPTDISRIGAQVVSGLGFIGAGTIIVTKKPTVKGLTTAAGLWASGIIGLAVGAGFYEGGAVATILIIFTETGFFALGRRIQHDSEFKVNLNYHHKPALDQVLRYCKDHKMTITNLQVTGSNDSEKSLYSATISLRPRSGVSIDKNELMTNIREIAGVIEETLEVREESQEEDKVEQNI